ncbi:hypothetical protein ZWY2020_010803 [Hordeum vulgare]|nr:hypothetical protein ZWY2020_010803 [Hordeum vulgare]
MASPSASGGGRPRELRWLDKSPPPLASPSRSDRQALCNVSRDPLASATVVAPRRIPRSEIHRVPSTEDRGEAPSEVVRCRRERRRRSPRPRHPRPARHTLQRHHANSPPRPTASPGDSVCSKCLYPGHPRSECRRD